ncbi:MAG TPA: ArgE/DapE family deacylase [Candidatus Acidoferrales bacterium]|nr:ArgE/DapE family deacylase [Candidatus Acidoferrales bacterium]
MPIDRKATLQLLEELIAIESVNPTLVPGASGEQRAAEHVKEFLCTRGVSTEVEAAAHDRSNVVAGICPANNPRDAKPALMIVAHIDTVGAGDMPDPFTPCVRDGKMYGRGALDIKSGVAAMCAAVVAVAEERTRLARPFIISAVVDEECDSIGTQALVRRGYTADCAIVLEPTNLQLVVAHKGYAWFEIVTHGRAAHGSLPSEGRDAIRMMGRVLGALDGLEKQIASCPAHPRLGHASVHASLIAGGQELSSYPAECRLKLERRMLPGETEASAEAEFRAMLAQLEKQDSEFRATLGASLGSRPAYEIAADSSLVQRTSAAIRKACGNCELAGMAAWTDTALLSAAGIPGMVFGPAGRGLHGAEEYVEIESVYKCAEALRELILEFCT